MTWISRLCGAAALLAASLPVQAQVVSQSDGRARTTDEAQPTPPGITVVEPRSDAVETFECRSLLTLLLVAIPPWERAAPCSEDPFTPRPQHPIRPPALQLCSIRCPFRWS